MDLNVHWYVPVAIELFMQFPNGEQVSQNAVSHLLVQNLVSPLLGQKPFSLHLSTRKNSHWCRLRTCTRRSNCPGQRREQWLTSQRPLLNQTWVMFEDHPTWAKGLQRSKNIYSTIKILWITPLQKCLGCLPSRAELLHRAGETTSVTQWCQKGQHLYSFDQRTLH